MGRGPKLMTEKIIAQWVAEGRGKGDGPNYLPWLTVFDFTSLGRIERTYSEKFGRTIHLMADVESNTFYALEWMERVTDLKEEYPLDRDITQEIAKALNIRHPYYPRTHVPMVMTVDFLVTEKNNGKTSYVGYDCKRTEYAEDACAIGYLQIVRTYLAGMDIPHRLVFHSKLPTQKIKSIQWIRGGLLKREEIERYPGYFREKCLIMANELSHSTRNVTLEQYCANFETRHGMSQGEGLRVAKMLMHERILLCDLNNPDLASVPLAGFRCIGVPHSPEAAGGL
jgi:hypothetical protein